MCFSAEADLVAGAVVAAIGVDALRQVRRPNERALGAIPVVLGAHLLVEALIWQSLAGDVAPGVGRQAMWVYLAVALLVVPVLVPFAIGAVEPDPGRRRAMTRLGAAGAALAGVYLVAMLTAPVAVHIEGSHLAYRLGIDHGGLLAGIYAIVVCAPPMLSSERRIAAFGVANLAAVLTLAWFESSALTSLWCAWAAVTSVAIAAHLRRAHRAPDVQVHVA